MATRRASSCKLKITDKNLKRVLGRAEDSEVIFDTFQEYLDAIPTEAEFLVAESDGHFIAKFRKLSYTDGDIKLLYSSEYGNGAVTLNEVLGPATEELLTKYKEELNPLARAKLIPPVPAETAPVSSEELIEGAGDSTGSLTADYDEDNSKIKIEQFESTTGQDVESDLNGTLDPRPSTLNRMVVKEALASAPGKYRTFIVKDSKDYFNEEGIEAEGEVLLVVHRLVYDEMAAELGRPLTLEEIKKAAVRVTDGQIRAEGEIYTIPLEGTSPNRNMEEDDQFFSRNHEARVQIYAEKYNVTEEEAEDHFRQGQANMQALRDRANYDPVEVTTRPSLGFATGEQMSIGDFDRQYNIQGLEFSINLNKSKIVGRVYVKGTMNGQSVEMLTVPVNLTERYDRKDLEAIAGRMLAGLASLDDIKFFSSIFGVNRRKAGPYMKIDGESFILMAGGKRVESLDQFNQALAANNWPAITNKVRGPEALSQHTILRAGKYEEVSPERFLTEHLATDGSLWTHRGKPVPYPANRYFYLDEEKPTISAQQANTINNAKIQEIERRRQEELGERNKAEQASIKRSTTGTPINSDSPGGSKVGDKFDSGMVVLVQDSILSEDFDPKIADNDGEGYEVIERVVEYGQMENGKLSKAPVIRVMVFNNKTDADAFLAERDKTMPTKAGTAPVFKKINAKYDAEIEALKAETRRNTVAPAAPRNTQETVTDRVNSIFEDVQEYDRIVTSNDPKDVERKLIAPQAFTPTFRLSQSYKRLRSGLKAIRTKAAGMFGFNAPVGQEYFNSMHELRDNLPAIVTNYAQADLIAYREGLRTESQPTTLLGTDIPALELLKAEITPATTDAEIEALLTPVIQVAITERVSSKIAEKTANTLMGLQKQGIMETETMGLGTDTPLTNFVQINEANKLIADIENQIMFGDSPAVQGTSPDVTNINDLPTETTFASVFSKEQQAPTQVVRSTIATTTNKRDKVREVEKRRQEALKNFKVGSVLNLYGSTGILEDTATIIKDNGESWRYRYSDGVETNINKTKNEGISTKEKIYGKRYTVLSTEKEINAKYDAEIVKLEDSEEQVMTLDTYRMIQRLSGKWTTEDEANYQEELAAFQGKPAPGDGKFVAEDYDGLTKGARQKKLANDLGWDTYEEMANDDTVNNKYARADVTENGENAGMIADIDYALNQSNFEEAQAIFNELDKKVQSQSRLSQNESAQIVKEGLLPRLEKAFLKIGAVVVKNTQQLMAKAKELSGAGGRIDFDMVAANKQAAAIPLVRDASGNLLAPNGNKSNLSPTQWRIVRTEAFKNWFGDWEKSPKTASKVVDTNGEPLVVFHGSPAGDFTIFKNSSIGELGEGSYFTASLNEADDYANRSSIGATPTVLNVFLNIKKPFVAKKADSFWDKFGGKGVSDAQTTANMIAAGYDGIMLEAPATWFNPMTRKVEKTGKTRKHLLTLQPTQVKLADGSNTSFDPNNADIRYSAQSVLIVDGNNVSVDGKVVYFGNNTQDAKRYINTNYPEAGRGAGFTTRDGKPIGFNYDTDQVARERFDLSTLPQIGKGSDRTVFDLGDGKVLKIAHNPRGLEQNIYEGNYYLVGVVPTVYERGLNYVVTDNVPRITAADKVETFDEDGNEMGQVSSTEMFKELQRFSQIDFDRKTSELQDVLFKYGFGDILSYEVLWNDFTAKRSWGYKDGSAYHIDAGTFGGTNMIETHQGKKPLSDPEFREIYDKSRAVKKQFGDTDKNTMFHYGASGEVLGFTHGGKIYLNGEKLTARTTMEEAGHVWINWTKENRKDLHQAGLAKVRGSSYLKAVEADKNYQAEALKQDKKGSREYNAYMEEEALAKAIADQGDKLVTNSKKADFKEWLKSLWKAVADAFGIRNLDMATVGKLSLEDFAKMAAADTLSSEAGPPKPSLELAYSGPVNVGLTEEGVSPNVESTSEGPVRYRVLQPSNPADAIKNRELLLAGAGMTTPTGETRYIGNFVDTSEAGPALSPEEQVMESLPTNTRTLPKTELSEYAESVLGKEFAEKLLSSQKNLTFDDINTFAGFVGDERFAATQLKSQSDFAISSSSAQAIAEGQKTITLRKRAEDMKGKANTAGLVKIGEQIFNIVDLGEMGLKKALETTGLTQNEFTQQFLGDDTKTIADVFDAGVKDFFAGKGARRVFTIKPLLTPYKSNSKKKGQDTKKRNEKTETLGCKKLR